MSAGASSARCDDLRPVRAPREQTEHEAAAGPGRTARRRPGSPARCRDRSAPRERCRFPRSSRRARGRARARAPPTVVPRGSDRHGDAPARCSGAARGPHDQRPGRQNGGHYPSSRGRPHVRQVHVLQARPRLAQAQRRGAGAGQGRVPGRLRGLRRGPLAASVFDGRHPRRHRPAAAQPEPDPRGHPHLPRRARPERPRPLGRRPPTPTWR